MATVETVPVAEAEPRMSHQAIVEGFRALRKLVKQGKMTAEQTIEEGHRYE